MLGACMPSRGHSESLFSPESPRSPHSTRGLVGAARGLLGAVVLLASTPCFADEPSPAHLAQAEDLFQRAKTAMVRRDFAAACPMFDESYRLAPAGGTLQNLAVCYEEQGKVAFAFARFNELRSLSQKANREDRVRLADEHIAALAPRISRLRVVLPPSPSPSTTVLVDGDPYGAASRSSGIALNVGEHVVRVSAPGKREATLRVTIAAEGAITTLEVPALADVPGARPGAARPIAGTRDDATLEDLDRVAGARARRTTGLVIGGVGLATLAAGGVFGVLTITTNDAAKNACRDNTGGALSTKTDASGVAYDTGLDFDPRGVCYGQTTPWRTANDLHDRASFFGTLSTVLIPLGLVGLAVGGTLVYSSAKTGARGRAITAVLTPAADGLRLQGEFQ